MDMNAADASRKADSPIAAAARKTIAIRKKLQVAGAELHLANAALERHLPPELKSKDVAHALAQRSAIEGKVREAADELSAVRELLDEADRLFTDIANRTSGP